MEIQEILESKTFSLKTELNLPEEKLAYIQPVLETGNVKDNLLYKTWAKARELEQSVPGIKIRLIKNIPPGGGLGGGSSNSGALWKFFLSKNYVSYNSALAGALSLGADIPFFLGPRAAWVTGIGEKMEEIQVANGFGVLCIPNISLPTGEMYSKLKKSLQKPRPSKSWNSQEGILISSLETGNWKALQGLVQNEFESVAFPIYPILREIRDQFLLFGADLSSMTGSGSAIYGITGSSVNQAEILSAMGQRFPELRFYSFQF